MPDIRINGLPLATGPTAPSLTDNLAIDGTSTRKAPLSAIGPVIRPFSSQAQAEAGTDNTTTMTPLTTAQAMAAVSATVAQGAKADTAMQPTIYDPNAVAKDAFNVSNLNFSVVRFGASSSNTSAQNETAFAAAEGALDVIYVPAGTYQLQNPMNRSYTARFYGPGILRFDNAQWTRRGGSSGDPLIPEHYTLFYEYENQADVTLVYAGVNQSFTWADEFTIIGSGNTTTNDLVEINITNGKRRLGTVPQAIKSFNTLDAAAPNIAPDHRAPPLSPIGYDNVFIGTQTPIQLTTASNTAMVGSRAGRSITTGGNNTGIGFQALYRTTTGSGNTVMGAVAGEWNTTGYDNVMIGGSANSHNRTGYQNVAVGTRSLSRTETSYNCTAVGFEAMFAIGDGNTVAGSTALGSMAGRINRGDRGVYVGYRAGHGTNDPGASGTDNTLVGWYSGSDATTGFANVAIGAQTLRSMTTAQNNVAVGYNALLSATTAVECVAVGREALSQNVSSPGSTAVGFLALSQSAAAGGNTAVGWRAGNVATSAAGLALFGYEAGRTITTGSDNTFLGTQAGRLTSTGGENTSVGAFSLLNNSTGIQNTSLGKDALRLAVDGTNQTNFNNTTGVGYGTRVSGSNQVQIGNSATTTYVYGTVQNRSDERDKADIRDTTLGLDFIMSLRPVDFRWDMREDYISFNETTGKIKRKKKDGSKKRSRFHHGFIAQELSKCGYDFGGLQDHSINGGADVMTVGYDEMIAPLVKAVQELTKRIKELEDK